MCNTKTTNLRSSELELPCKMCGKIRVYTQADVKRNRAKELCQPCSVKAYNSTRTRKSKKERAETQAKWFQKNKDRTAKYYADYRHKIRLEMVDAYGGQCQHCGESDPIVLVLDHVRDDAQEDRKMNNHSGGYKMYLYLKRNNWPKDGYQLLCHNCNFRKEYERRKNAVKIR